MPHCIVEYSQNLDQEVPPAEWLEAVKKACIASSIFDVSDIKLRGIPYKNFITGGEEDAFVHVTIRMLSGRTMTQRSELSALILRALEGFTINNVSFTVDVVEMEISTYAKKVVCLNESQ